MTEETIEVLKFGSEELTKELEYEGGDFMKFELGKPINIEVLESQGAVKNIKEFEVGKPVVRFDIKILVEDTEKTWSVSRKVLDVINSYIHDTKKFKIVRKEMSYDVIPLGLKD